MAVTKIPFIAGIVCDNYKVDKFKKELTSNGFNDFEVNPFDKTTSNIKICEFVELYFKKGN
jgi:hypothetical protein